jgi:N-formylglutamate deformylase
VVVLYDAHAIRSRVPRLFDGVLPQFNIGTYSGRSCAAALVAAVVSACDPSRYQCVVDGRFKGGYITRRYGRPAEGVHAIQMELACRAYLHEPEPPLTVANWPPEYDPGYAAPLRERLQAVLQACLNFARTADRNPR